MPLPTSREVGMSLLNEVVLATGFGSTETSRQASQFLRFTFVRVISNSQCAQRYSRSVVRDTTICTIGFQDDRRSICAGDSGSPLLTFRNRQWVLVAIASFISVDGCGANRPSGYLRVGPYLSWINQVTNIPIS